MKFKLSAIEMDTSIQTRTHIDMATVNEYAERMVEGDTFPPVELYGTKDRAWIADGWTRIMAAQSMTFKDIDANLHPGGRTDALKAALSANTKHGQPRKRQDVDRVIELALKEFGKLSDRALGEMCGVADVTIAAHRPKDNCKSLAVETRIGKDGKTRKLPKAKESPASDPPADLLDDEPAMEPAEKAPEPATEPMRKPGPPCRGMQMARIAIMKLGEITKDDTEREEAFATVKEWINEHE